LTTAILILILGLVLLTGGACSLGYLWMLWP